MGNLSEEEQLKCEITIGENKVNISCFVSISDMQFFQESRKLDSSKIVLGILSNHIDEKFKSKLDTVSGEDIEKFIDAYVKSDKTLEYYFKNSISVDINDRFAEALELYYDDSMSKAREMLESVPESKNRNRTIDSVQFSKNSRVFKKLRELNRISLKLISDYNAVFANLNKLSSDLSELIKNIRIPSLSDEQKDELMESYKTWGEYGWTFPPTASVTAPKSSIFNKKPKSLEDANESMRKYINAESMEMLFNELRELESIKKDVLEEAIKNFEEKEYMSCAFIIFSLIDRKTICCQKEEENRKVGLRGIEQIFKRMELKVKDQWVLFFILYFNNIHSALRKTFKNGDNFKTQPDVINRNFLCHGMYSGEVTRRDAAQLFLLLYNWVTLNDFLNQS